MDGIRLTTLSTCLASACEQSPEITPLITRWIAESRTAGARTAAEIRMIGGWLKRRLCHPDEPFMDCPATIFNDPNKWCSGCSPEVADLVRAVDSFPKKRG